MLHRYTSFASALLACTALVACSSPGSASREVVQQASAPIINGTDSDDSQNAVILLGLGAGGGSYDYCSGTLIAPNIVLTARHCVSETGESGCAKITSDDPPDSLRIYLGKTRTEDWISHAPDALGKKVFVDDGDNLCSHDIALILLDTELVFGDTGLAPIRIDSPPARLDTFTAIGWGVTDKTGDPGVRSQRTDIQILKVDVPGTEFVVGESICHGDSGGPAISTTTGAILGVVSRGGNDDGSPVGTPAAGCVGPTTQNIYTGLWGHKDLILSAFAESGYEPWLEGQPDPRKKKFGGVCSTGNDCQSAICLKIPVVSDAGVDAVVKDTGSTASTKGFCSQACAPDALCPTDYDCSAVAFTPVDAGTTDGDTTDGGTSSSVCIKHVDAPPTPPAVADSGKSGCSTSATSASKPSFDPSLFAFGLIAAAALMTARRTRRAP